MQCYNELLTAVRLLISEDRCEGRFVFGRQALTSSDKPKKGSQEKQDSGVDNPKGDLQTLLARAGQQEPPSYKTSQLGNKFRSTVRFSDLDFVGRPCGSKKEAEKDAAAEALSWLTGEGQSSTVTLSNMSTIMKKNRKDEQAYVSRRR